MKTQDVGWCKNMFRMLDENGMWAIPRSGLIFKKQDGKLVLDQAMPWLPEMEGLISEEQLREQQDAEFEAVREHFAAAGIPVERR